jgi:hypothetical protein
MDGIIHFTLTGARSDDQGIREVEGRVGSWPFGHSLRFCVGANCDAIVSSASGIIVYGRGTLIARSRAQVGRHTRRARSLAGIEWVRTLARH